MTGSESAHCSKRHPPLSPAQLGFTPLWVAGHEGHVDVVRALLDHGADVEAKDEVAMTTHARADTHTKRTSPRGVDWTRMNMLPDVRTEREGERKKEEGREEQRGGGGRGSGKEWC